MTSVISDAWLNEQAIAQNGVFFPSDCGYLLQLRREEGLGRFSVTEAKLVSVDEISPFDWSDLTQTFEAQLSPELKVSCGEGSAGGDGFIALEGNGALVWLAFFDCSNPFVSVCSVGDRIVATSSHGRRWALPVRSPERLTVM